MGQKLPSMFMKNKNRAVKQYQPEESEPKKKTYGRPQPQGANAKMAALLMGLNLKKTNPKKTVDL